MPTSEEGAGMEGLDLVLGLDSSTQGTSAVILRREDFTTVRSARVRYRDDPRLSTFGLSGEAPHLPATEEGEAHQPAPLFAAALEALLSDLPEELLARVAAVNLSAQQHGQVWLGEEGLAAITTLGLRGAGIAAAPGLAERLSRAFAWERAPIWLEGSASAEAAVLREAAGGGEAMTRLTGSDSPLRFTGAVLAHEARRHPEAWARTKRVHLLSSFLSSLLTADPGTPIDWGNGSGTSLMDWSERKWDGGLLEAAAGLVGDDGRSFAKRLPGLDSPFAFAGSLAAYFVERYGMSPNCRVLVGSGDNPQSKVLAEGHLLSLGTSFVLMAEGLRPHASANAMYDGLGAPFLFGCRTNGALVWERVRRNHGIALDDFAASEEALRGGSPADVVRSARPPRILQLERESFPVSGAIDAGGTADFRSDYAGVVDSSLGLLWLGSRGFSSRVDSISVTGGASASEAVLERVAAIWGARVRPLADIGAARGAAVAAALALDSGEEFPAALAEARRAIGGVEKAIEPRPELLRAFHGEGGYLSILEREARRLGIDI